MLENLDKIDWQNVNHAYGPAVDVPEMLRCLMSDDANIRSKAIEDFHITICHQGSVYEATVFTVPFLLELLEADQVQSKKDILVLLGLISISYSHSFPNTGRLYELINYSLIPPDSDEAWANNIRNSRRAVRQGIPLFLKLLQHADREVRSAAAGVLACLKEDAVVTIPEVYKASQCDPDELARASMVLALGSLTLPKEPYLQHLKDLMSNAESGLIKVAAATALSNLEKEQIPPEVIEVLINAICSPKPVADLYSRLPWIHMYWTSDDISVQAGKELLYLGYDKVKFAVPRLIEFFKEALASYRSANTFEALLSLRNMVYILLSLVFNEKPVVPNTNVQQLTDDQRMVLATITEVTNGWADVSELLQEFGLPVSRDELQRFLRGEISLPDTPDEIFGSLGW